MDLISTLASKNNWEKAVRLLWGGGGGRLKRTMSLFLQKSSKALAGCTSRFETSKIAEESAAQHITFIKHTLSNTKVEKILDNISTKVDLRGK